MLTGMILEILAGLCIGLALLGVGMWALERNGELLAVARSSLNASFVRSRVQRKRILEFPYLKALREAAEFQERPERVGLWIRLGGTASAAIVALAIIIRAPLLIVLVPLVYVAQYVYAKEVVRTERVKLNEQTRLTQILIAFLLRSGASIGETMELVEQYVEEPLQSKIHVVNTTKRYTTLQGALHALSEQTDSRQLSEFATLISESQTYGTRVADSVMRGLQLDGRLRDANANRKYGEIQLELTLYAMFLIAFPGFGFVLYALLSYVLKIFTGAVL